MIKIEKETNQLILYKDGVVQKVYPVATGRTPEKTPEGKFEIITKFVKPGWKSVPGGVPENPLGERWLGFRVNGDEGRTYGIHGTNDPSSIGSYASSGCIRMYNHDVIELYNIVPMGTPVQIEGIGSTEKKAQTLTERNKHKNTKEQAQSVTQRNEYKSTKEQPQSVTQRNEYKNKKVVVQSDLINIRSAPSLKAPIIQNAYAGSTFTAIGKEGAWLKIKLLNGQTAYLHETLVRPASIEDVSSGKLVVNAPLANIRSDTSLEAPVLQRVAYGKSLIVENKKNGWYVIKMKNGNVGYIHSSVVQTL